MPVRANGRWGRSGESRNRGRQGTAVGGKEEKRGINPVRSETPPITSMSALSEASTPAQDAAPPSIDTQQLQQHNQQLPADFQGQPQQGTSGSGAAQSADSGRKRAYAAPLPAVVRPDLSASSQGAVGTQGLHRLSRRQDKM